MRLILNLLLVSFAVLRAGDWITSGGNPARSGLSDIPGPDQPSLLWEGTVPGIFGAPVFISGNRLVTMRFQSLDYAPIVCHDLATGETLWTRDFTGPNSRSLPIGIRDGKVYAVNFQESQHDTLYCLDADDGHIFWRGQVTTWMSITESATFCDNGDLLVTAPDFRIARVNCATGDTVWTTRRVWPATGSADICVYGDRAYAYGGDIGSFYLIAIDLATGAWQDTVRIPDTHPGGPMPQAAPMVGPDGTIYAHKAGDNVTAVRDFGDSLHILWVHEISGDYPYYSVFAHFAVGPDSTVYVASSGRLVRLDPATGAAIESSAVIQDPSSIFGVRLAIGSDGIVYADNDGSSNGALYAFTPGLQELWRVPIPNPNTSGPAIGPNGELAMAGAGNVLKVFRRPAGTRELSPARIQDQSRPLAFPNPFRTRVLIRSSPAAPNQDLRICDASGRVIRRLATGQAGRVWWDGCDETGLSCAPGVYIGRFTGSAANIRLVRCQ